MAQRLLVGDLVRPTVAEAAHRLPCWSRHHWGPQFQARRPALVVHIVEPNRDRDSFLCLVAFRLKNGKWKQDDRRFPFLAFDLVHRPSSSRLLNPFDLHRATPVVRTCQVDLAKSFYAVIPHADGPSTPDPDVPLVIGDRPVVPERLGQEIRSSLGRIESRQHHFVDGRWQEPFFAATLARSKASFAAACEQVRTRYKVSARNPFGDGSSVFIQQLHDCFGLYPMTRHGGGGQTRCPEATRYIGQACTDREFGDLVLGILNQPSVKADHAAKADPFVGRILPFIDIDAMEADIGRHRAQ